MLDRNGTLIRIGDRLDIGESWATGVVVCSMDTDDYSPMHSKAAWAYVERGILIATRGFGLMHSIDISQELEIVDPSPD